jgi:RNA polymerase-binding transcription factor DksA
MRSPTATVSPSTGTISDGRLAPERLEQFAALLEEQRSMLLARAARLGIDIEQLQTLTATNGQGETEHASSGVERAVAELLEAGTLEALEEVASALARIDDGSYGMCAACGVPIRTERLLAMPQTRHCVTCRQARERGGR